MSASKSVSESCSHTGWPENEPEANGEVRPCDLDRGIRVKPFPGQSPETLMPAMH